MEASEVVKKIAQSFEYQLLIEFWIGVQSSFANPSVETEENLDDLLRKVDTIVDLEGERYLEMVTRNSKPENVPSSITGSIVKDFIKEVDKQMPVFFLLIARRRKRQEKEEDMAEDREDADLCCSVPS